MRNSILLLLCAIILINVVQGQGGAPLVQPPIVDSADGLLDITLTIEYGNHSGPGYMLTNTRLLNGSFPGPAVRVQAGDMVKVLFQNMLQQQEGTTFPMNELSMPDHSNLYFHGAHISGELPSDDVSLAVAPGESYQYETTFPSDHMSGTHWIHPMLHGSSSIQVGGGAGMAMIVKDPEGFLPAQVANATDILLFVQHMSFTDLKYLINATNDGIFSVNTTANAADELYTVNGQYQPVLSMKAGEWQRWRIVMAGWLLPALNFAINTSSCEMQLLAKDGIYISDFPRNLTVLPIPTGGRADVMVRCSETGTYDVISRLETPFMTIDVAAAGNDTVASQDLESWTPTYPDYLSDLRDVSATPGCACLIDLEPCEDVPFGLAGTADVLGGPISDDLQGCINEELYDPNVYFNTVPFGSVVERDLRDADDFPYHQNIYAYQVISFFNIRNINDAFYYQAGDWHDVVNMETRSLIIRYRADIQMGVVTVYNNALSQADKGAIGQELITDGGECVCDSDAVPPPSQQPVPPPSQEVPQPTNVPTQAPTVESTSSSSLPSLGISLAMLLFCFHVHAMSS